MSELRLLPESVVALCMIVLALALTVYLYTVPRKSKATWWLAISMTGHVIFLIALMLMFSSGQPGSTLLGAMQLGGLFLSLTAGIGFAYHFIENPFGSAWKRAVVFSGLVSVIPLMMIVPTLQEVLNASGLIVDLVIAVCVVILTGWTFVVFARKTVRFSRRETDKTGRARLFIRAAGRAARACRAFGVLALLLLLIAILVGVSSTGVLSNALSNYLLLGGFLAYFFSVAVIYVNHAAEPTSFQVKIVSFGLATVLAVLGLTTLVVFDTVDLARSSHIALPRSSIHFEPTPEGGYRVTEGSEIVEPDGGEILDMENGDSVPMALGFAFPFAGASWDTVYVDDDGYVSFGGGHSLLVDFGASDEPVLAPYFTAMNPAQGGRVRTERVDDRVRVMWDELPQGLANDPVTAELELAASGAVTFRYGYIAPSAVFGIRGLFPEGRPDAVEGQASSDPIPASVGGAFKVAYQDEFTDFVHSRVSNMAWIVLGSTFFVLLGFPFLLRSSLTRPLTWLLEGVRQVNAGDLDAKVPVPVRDELGHLALNFNRMTESLKSAEIRLRAHAEELKQRVKERTWELEESLEDLRATQAQLVQQEKMASLGALTAGIAHEIKNPLNFVNNFAALSIELADELSAEIAAVKPRIGEDAEELEVILSDLRLNAQKITEHGRRADGIVRSMLQHSRGRTGERQEIDINELLDDYVNLAYHGMRAQDARFNCRIDRDFDAEIGEISVVPQDLGRVFINLLNNAFYAVNEKSQSSNGEYEPAVSVRTEGRGGEVLIELTDNGPGIPTDLQERIFEPFYTTKPTGSGTGLGLSLSYDIITREHQGAMDVRSEPGKETTFTIRLPVVHSDRIPVNQDLSEA